ncbi:hypothetical protein SAMN05414138_1028 [Rhodoplanes sp. JGI PP 4-B12]|uniref:hypothetical protein n=1 Tax=Rhodoplanes sp. JGI PP 4-B12 TaxID=1873883 RepID=UPI000B514919|nr:hypothetical protein [Rhodoplanes sp. JGI PP 4-B12]SNB53928.1 hypothetical protein SAMN05414138_1028 [Rhodoplanes sp. JGI PP 4-B12]
MGAGGAAAGLSLGAIGLQAYGDYTKAEGIAAGDTFKAEELQRAAEYGELKATQTNAQITRNLNITLGNIDAVRAAARANPTSPTGVAVRDYAEQVGTEQKTIAVTNILSQVQQQEADAAYLRSAASNALLSGKIAVAGDIVGGLSGGMRGMGSGGGGYVSDVPNPAGPYTTGAPY